MDREQKKSIALNLYFLGEISRKNPLTARAANGGHWTDTFKEKGTPGKSARPRRSPDNSVCSFECSSAGLYSVNGIGNVKPVFKSLVVSLTRRQRV